MTAKKTARPEKAELYPHLRAKAPALVEKIEEARDRRKEAIETAKKRAGGLRIRPHARGMPAPKYGQHITAEQCVSFAGWYIGEAICMAFEHDRGEKNTVPCDTCLAGGTTAALEAYDVAVKRKGV